MPLRSADEPMARRAEVDAHLGAVRRIAVFRALVLGDMLCATPALRALRRRFPGARITLIGLPWAAELATRLDSVDDFIAFPGHALLPERKPDTAAWPGFVEKVKAARFDLLLQLHGSGRVTNGIVTEWGARHVAAFHEPALTPPDPLLSAVWPSTGLEPQRLMKLVAALGPPDGHADAQRDLSRWQLDFPLRSEDAHAAQALLARHGVRAEAQLVCLHAGAQLPSRRWPLARFVEVARALAEQGHTLLLTGVPGEKALADALQAAAPAERCVNLVGETTLWTLGALIQRSRLLVCNDTGVSHVAAALGTPSVVISCGAEVSRWAPADAAMHQVLWSDQPCRPCAHVECPTEHECAWGVGAASVLDAAQTLLAARA